MAAYVLHLFKSPRSEIDPVYIHDPVSMLYLYCAIPFSFISDSIKRVLFV